MIGTAFLSRSTQAAWYAEYDVIRERIWNLRNRKVRTLELDYILKFCFEGPLTPCRQPNR